MWFCFIQELMEISKEDCVDNSYYNYTMDIMNTTVKREDLGPGIRQWIYQTCTQFGYCKSYKCVMSWENQFMAYANNKGADQPAYLCSLISAFFIHCLHSQIGKFALGLLSLEWRKYFPYNGENVFSMIAPSLLTGSSSDLQVTTEPRQA